LSGEDGLQSILDAQLFEHVMEMNLHGAFFHDEPSRNIAV
jgi:hypothetical protein